MDKLDILIDGSIIQKIQKDITDHEAQILDASGKYVCPGLIDMHTNLKEPGREDIGTIKSGSESAASGGFTSIACMPNTNPVIDDLMGIEYILSRTRSVGLVNIFPIGAVTKGNQGKELTNISSMVEAGAVALTDVNKSIMDSSLMRSALEYVKMFNIPIISHCEDSNLSEDGCINESRVSTILGFKGIPSIAEELMVSRDIILSRFTQSRIHFAHITTRSSVEMIRISKKDNIPITCGTTPHHFSLSEEDILKSPYDTNLKIQPPLRSQDDLSAIKEGLQDGTIDTIATDHDPWLDNEKDIEFINAPFGIVSFETAIPLIFENLVTTKYLSIQDVIEKISLNPSKILNLHRGILKNGFVADITIIDPELEINITKDFFHSICKNSPFIGRKLKGFAVYTIVNGQIIYDRYKDLFCIQQNN